MPILDPVMQDGKKLPKWKPRSRQGKFLGLSKEHATSVGLILNPTTKRISPQFHLLYDDFFSTVQSIDRRDVPHVSEEDWEFSFRQGTEMSYDPHERDPALQPPPISNEWLEQDEIGRHDELRRDQRERARIHRENFSEQTNFAINNKLHLLRLLSHHLRFHPMGRRPLRQILHPFWRSLDQ